PRLALAATVPAGGTCGRASCWRPTGSGFRYTNALARPDGVRQIVLKEGLADGKAKIAVRGKGGDLRLPQLPLAQDPRVTVQLRNSAGACWEARYESPART